jgi:hypothetical protein
VFVGILFRFEADGLFKTALNGGGLVNALDNVSEFKGLLTPPPLPLTTLLAGEFDDGELEIGLLDAIKHTKTFLIYFTRFPTYITIS